MAERNRARSAEAPLCCEVAWLRRRRELEETPMRRVQVQEDADCAPCCGCACACGGCPELAALVEEQNKLLYDILGAVNCLTAAHLTADQRKNG